MRKLRLLGPFCFALLCEAQTTLYPYDSETTAFSYFVTRPDIETPRWQIKVYDPSALQDGMYWFVAPYLHLDEEPYPMWKGPRIYRTNGELVWSGEHLNNATNTQDFRAIRWSGDESMLTFIHPQEPKAAGQIYDKTYTLHAALDTRGPVHWPNMHEFNVVQGGKTALILSKEDYTPYPVEVEGYSGNCSAGWQGPVELDVATGETLFEWNARGEVDLDESVGKQGSRAASRCADGRDWDVLHMNSVDRFDNGDYLVSMRNLNTVIRISREHNTIVWRLGGLKSDFEFGRGAKFTAQHHVRFHGQNQTHTLISLFNNNVDLGNKHADVADDPEGESCERTCALILALRTDVTPMTAEVVTRYEKPVSDPDFAVDPVSPTRGSVDVLPNGNIFVGWVDDTHISEHAPDGRLLMQAKFRKRGANSYRSYKRFWVGLPAQPPDVVARAERGDDGKISTIVWVSWNGATEVASWRVLGGTDAATERLATKPRDGFETMLSFQGYAKYVVVIGLDVEGEELGRSTLVKTEVASGLNHGVLEKAKMQTFVDYANVGPPGSLWLVSFVSSAVTAMMMVLGVAIHKSWRKWKHKRHAYRPVGDTESTWSSEESVDEADSERKLGWDEDVAAELRG